MANNSLKITKFQNGTAAAPGVTFQDTSCGFYRYAANVFGWAANGVTSILFGLRYLSVLAYSSDPILRLCRAQGTQSSPTATTDGANLGSIVVYGHNGTEFRIAGQVRVTQDGAAGTGIPGKVSIYGSTNTSTAVEGLVVRATGAVEIKKGATLGSAATDVLTCAGRLVLRQIANTTSKPGSLGEIVYNTGDSKVYVCTSASETAATWAALN